MTTVYILPTGRVWHRYLDHLKVRQQGRARAYTLPVDQIPFFDLRPCYWCEARRVAAEKAS